LDNFRRYNQNS